MALGVYVLSNQTSDFLALNLPAKEAREFLSRLILNARYRRSWNGREMIIHKRTQNTPIISSSNDVAES